MCVYSDLSTDIDALRDTIKAHAIDLVIIDPLTAYLGRVEFASGRGCLEAHLDAARDADRGYQCRTRSDRAPDQVNNTVKALSPARAGRSPSSRWRESAYVWRLKPTTRDRRSLSSLKNNLTLAPPSLPFRLQDGAVEWESDPVDVSADEMLSPELHQRRAPSTPADEFGSRN